MLNDSTGTTKGLRLYIERRLKPEEKNADAWVLIWYMHPGCVGHASMFIGDISSRSRYVSWWPERDVLETEGRKSLIRKLPARVDYFSDGEFSTTTYEEDFKEEHRLPDVVYGLQGLDQRQMEEAWKDICCGKTYVPSFSLLGKNCASIVRRVLKAGLSHTPFRYRVFGFMDGDFYVCTPKRIAVVCDQLRDSNMAIKIKLRAGGGFTPLQSILRLR
ncbi:hypothetical protein [Enterobacter mori]|uniref:hypothetical protein n=1 Tax=Enterobacter mori TaxID=539813 RepID=UPI003B840CEB